ITDLLSSYLGGVEIRLGCAPVCKSFRHIDGRPASLVGEQVPDAAATATGEQPEGACIRSVFKEIEHRPGIFAAEPLCLCHGPPPPKDYAPARPCQDLGGPSCRCSSGVHVPEHQLPVPARGARLAVRGKRQRLYLAALPVESLPLTVLDDVP